MEEIILLFSPEELIELAKQLLLARCFYGNVTYENIEMADEIMNRVCATGMAKIPESGAFREGGPAEPLFMPALELEQECQPLIDLYNDRVLASEVTYRLADRDFMERYHTLDPEIILNNPDMLAALKAIQKKYVDEFERYGVTHLRLDERK